MSKKPLNTKDTMTNFIFDPLTTIIKLAILKNKKIGTKISINNNNIYIQEIGMFQSIVRYYYGDTKNDIHYLSVPIELACNMYINDKIISKIPDIILLFKCAQDGLTNLMQTYIEFPIIIHCLKYYYSIIETHINEQSCDRKSKPIKIKTDSTVGLLNTKSKNKNKDKISPETSSDIVDEIITDIPEQIYTIPTTNTNILYIDLYTAELLERFNLIWTESRINIILGMIKYLIIEIVPIDYVKCIESFIIPIDTEIYNCIHK